MITISILGLDQYVAGHYSKDHTRNIADLYDVSEDEILFYAPNSYIFHKGVEQTSWNSVVRVHAPVALKKSEPRIAKYLLDTLRDFCINITVQFFYVDVEHEYSYVNEEYPHFITEENMVSVDEQVEEGEDNFEDILSNFSKINN